MTNKPKTNKWGEIMKSSVNDTVKFTNLFYRVKSVQDLKELITQTQQETREEVDKNLYSLCQQLYTIGLNDGKNKINYFPKPPGFYADKMRQTIKQRKEEGK
jgi:uncharacterized protein YcbK (DUF882 family)